MFIFLGVTRKTTFQSSTKFHLIIMRLSLSQKRGAKSDFPQGFSQKKVINNSKMAFP